MSILMLDNLDYIKKIDTSCMLDLVLGFPKQCREAMDIAIEWNPSFKVGDELDMVVISGLGDSAIAGDMAGALITSNSKTPFIVNRDYHLPAYVTNQSLVACVSYSGDTEETLAAYSDAKNRKARIVCITCGGRLAELAGRDGVDLVTLPGGRPPRSALGYLLVSLLVVLHKVGSAPAVFNYLPAAIELLEQVREEWKPELTTADNDCKLMALELHERIPLIYSATGLPAAIAYRWKTQLNQNAKIHAFTNTFPELNHNELVGWELASLERGDFAAVFIRDPEDTSRIADRINITSTLIPQGFMTREILLQGDNGLEKLLTGVFFGDLMSIYLAFAYDIDPTAIAGIERLKEELAQTGK